MAEYNYADRFESQLAQKYERELVSYELTQSNQGIKFINAQTIKLPKMTVSGYKDHNRRTIGFNAGTVDNEWEPKKLDHDRDIEIAIDLMDVDETNLVLEMANVQNTFEEEQAIPEKDSYTFSKLLTEAETYKSSGAIVDTSALTAADVLDWFDERMSEMDDASVPEEGRLMYLTAKMNKLFKQAEGITRVLGVGGSISAGAAGVINRKVHSVDDVTFKTVPSGRFKTKYNFTDGCVPAAGAKQINMMLVHPSCVIARNKYSYIKVFTPGSDSRTTDKYLFQNRSYMGAFLIERKAPGIAINKEADD